MNTLRAKLSLAAVTLTGLLSHTLVQAQDLDLRPNIYGGISWIDQEDNRMEGGTRMDDEIGFVIGGERPLQGRWSGVLEVWGNNADFKDLPGDANFNYYRIGTNRYFDVESQLKPYLSLGLGRVEFDPYNSNNSGATGVDVGIGARTMLGENFLLRGDIKGVFSEGGNFDTLVGLTIGYAFGRSSTPAPAPRQEPAPADSDGDGVVDSRDQCPNTPAGVRVDSRGCELDSDGDGVVDSQDNCPGTSPNVAVDQFGCAITDTVEVRQTLEVLFDTNQAVIKPEFNSELRDFAEFMNSYPNSRTVIEGHTDSDGAEAYNQELSQRRAQAIVDALVANHGIARNRLEAIGYGETRPIASNDTATGKAQNRRTEALVTAEIERERAR